VTQLSFLLNAVLFLFVGLECRSGCSMRSRRAGILGVALLISAAVIVARIIWIFPAAYVRPGVFRGCASARAGIPNFRP